MDPELHDALLRAELAEAKGVLFDVEALYVENVDTSGCEALIRMLSERGPTAQASVAFMFRDYDDRGEFIFLVPEVRRFVRALHEKMRHLFYFLSLDPRLAQMTEFAAAFSTDDDKFVRVGTSMSIEFSDEVVEALFERLVAVWQFAELVGDDAERVVTSIVAQRVPDDLLHELVADVSAAAGALGPDAGAGWQAPVPS